MDGFPGTALEVEMQGLSLESRDAEHHLSAGSLFFVGQIDVVVQQLAVAECDPCFALPAGTAATEKGRIDAGRLNRLQHALMMTDMDGLAGARQLDRKGLAGLGGQKALGMQVLLRPARLQPGLEYAVDQARGTADIEMRAERLAVEQAGDRNAIVFGIAIDLHPMPSVVGDEVLAICAAVARPNGIMQFELGTLAGKLLHHGDEGRDPDAAGNQQMFAAAPIRLEQIDRMGDPHLVAFAHLLVHEGRAATRIIDMKNADLVGRAIIWRRHQRVGVAPEVAIVVHRNDDVSATGEVRHRPAIQALEAEALDAMRNGRHLGHADGNFGTTAHRNNSSGSGALPGSSASILTP
ncbi:hypothetical protein EMEDMD4_440003 [Sinorhizobium medicae]|uniref:Uncharacterized protein n=1 Tax=Sinorhizobium medicae TaxID=110321 RepID=A0A508WYY0_9HYPH|nr:hypothetical protein EMEDMD4_440003 [Sinorhizobium medicae]